jgi:hypothetical protein
MITFCSFIILKSKQKAFLPEKNGIMVIESELMGILYLVTVKTSELPAKKCL